MRKFEDGMGKLRKPNKRLIDTFSVRKALLDLPNWLSDGSILTAEIEIKVEQISVSMSLHDLIMKLLPFRKHFFIRRSVWWN